MATALPVSRPPSGGCTCVIARPDTAPAIHHRAFDEDLVGISPDYEVRIASRLLEEEDGPMLDLLKKAHATAIQVPKRKALQPDRELLALRFDAFQSAA